MRFLMTARAATLAVLTFAALASTPAAVNAQAAAAPGSVLTLEEARELARRNNPIYLQTVRNVDPANMRVRSAYGAFIPTVNTSLSSDFREGRPQFFGGQAFGATSDVISSGYQLDARMSINSGTLLGPRAARARLDAAEADVTSARQTLTQQVTLQYISVLEQQAQAQLQDTLVTSAQAQVELAEARSAAGAATVLDVQRARVQLGQQEVQRLRARNGFVVEKLRLFQQLAVDQPDDVQLVSALPVFEPQFQLDELLSIARGENPELLARRSREDASQTGLSQTRGQYAPTLNLFAGVGGFTQTYTDNSFVLGRALSGQRESCQFTQQVRSIVGQPVDPTACSGIVLSPDQEQSLLQGNRQFPFGFTRNPYTVGASLSLPLFNGFQRELQVQEAAATRDNARYAVRAYELQLLADVSGTYRTLLTDYQAIAIQGLAAATARQALELSQERYRVGATNFVEVAQAQADFATAQTEYVRAVYAFHRSFANLEAAVGRPLR